MLRFDFSIIQKEVTKQSSSLKNRCLSVHIYLTQDRSMKYDIAWDASKNAFRYETRVVFDQLFKKVNTYY